MLSPAALEAQALSFGDLPEIVRTRTHGTIEHGVGVFCPATRLTYFIGQPEIARPILLKRKTNTQNTRTPPVQQQRHERRSPLLLTLLAITGTSSLLAYGFVVASQGPAASKTAAAATATAKRISDDPASPPPRPAPGRPIPLPPALLAVTTRSGGDGRLPDLLRLPAEDAERETPRSSDELASAVCRSLSRFIC